MSIHIDHKETWLHTINPSFKLLIMVGLFIFMLFIHYLNWLCYLTLIFLFLLASFSGYSYRTVCLMVLPFFLVFVSTSSSMILFGKGQTTWLKWGLIHITEESYYRGIHIGLRAFSFATLGLLFALTTRPVMLIYSLMQQLGLKPKYAYSFLAGLRLLPIMIEEFFTIRNAMKIRGVKEQRGIKSLRQKMKSYLIPLLAQSIRRAHRIAVAMETKGFHGNEKRTYFYKASFSKYDGYFIGSILIVLVVSYYASIHLPLFPTGDVRYGN
ncbi:energy-coupling factor transporter transmembrane protein EcfT [Bacillus sp. BHET2]|uniref:energy-coupling factor transporter transmembrane component T family protein n=1 Tax=Bacillus sp. BHET2 TaxID=2583818 RepID=UPI00110DA835|nr:energy-coupling factor transporter transmembrane component T [Bacillus sp. BHET2]TMU87369.1 energy-coupling factor transporter transmembrane protein EcfT [Bacillus sp. BHET2]